MKIPPSIFNAYNICPRQAWLMSRQMTADQENTFLNIGKLIDETTYQREKKKIYIADISAQIDMVSTKNGQVFIAEIKKSSKRIDNAKFQLKYYLYLLKKKGIKVKGIIKIPREKKSINVELNEDDIKKIIEIEKKIKEVLACDHAPDVEKVPMCKKCAHYDFCWS